MLLYAGACAMLFFFSLALKKKSFIFVSIDSTKYYRPKVLLSCTLVRKGVRLDNPIVLRTVVHNLAED